MASGIGPRHRPPDESPHMNLAKFLPQVILLVALTQAPSVLGSPAPPSAEVLQHSPVARHDIRMVWLMDLLMPGLLGIVVLCISRFVAFLGAHCKRRPATDRGFLQRRQARIKSCLAPLVSPSSR